MEELCARPGTEISSLSLFPKRHEMPDCKQTREGQQQGVLWEKHLLGCRPCRPAGLSAVLTVVDTAGALWAC